MRRPEMHTSWLEVGGLSHYNTTPLPPPPPPPLGLVGMAFVITLLHGHGFLIGQKVGMICRVMCTNAIYQKVRCTWKMLTCKPIPCHSE